MLLTADEDMPIDILVFDLLQSSSVFIAFDSST